MKKVLIFYFIGVTLVLHSQTYVNPLDRIAEYNLNGVNEFATGDIWSLGKLFQWGRNIPFDMNNYELENTSQLSSISIPDTWGNKYILSPDISSNWYKGGSNLDTWSSVVKEAVNNGASQSYLGNNEGDPSPKGYHIPTSAELKAIVYALDFSKIGTTSLDVEEKGIDISGRGVAVNYVADYQYLTSTIIVAVRFKNTEQATAFKYEWFTNRGLEISAKKINSNLTISDIANKAFDWCDATVRRFSATAQRDNNATYANSGRITSLQTSKATNDRTALVLQIVNSTSSYPGRGRSFAYPIRPIKNYVDESTAIAILDSPKNKLFEVVSERNGLLIMPFVPMYVNVYDVVGKLVFSRQQTEEDIFVPLSKGVYVVGGKDIIVKTVVH